MSKPKISAEVSSEEMAAYRDEAQRMGFTLSEWMRRALNSSLPKAPPPQVADVAFAKLDEPSGQTGMQTLLAGPDAVQAPPPGALPAPTVFEKLPTTQPVQNAHPCMYLVAGGLGSLRKGEVGGSCDHGSQRGKPCFWNAQVAAKNCGVFSLRLDLRTSATPHQQGARLRR